ncbi:putative F-box/FBD/LRR-repeat protein At4g03220, partial [Setaria viridis]|uniref:putative F-box/FBD/LRR-repeat protein At4g03220 n=1 Tax=Setaria viridis TaxID=4556 RepID=UPI003B3BD494
SLSIYETAQCEPKSLLPDLAWRGAAAAAAAAESPPRAGSYISSTGAGALEDRLSALPDDVLILLRLDTTAEATRTSVLSHRWRGVWTLLPELHFHLDTNGHRIREVLLTPDAPPPLLCISVIVADSAPDSLGAWIPEAARRLSGDLGYYNMFPGMEEEEEEAGERGAVQLPCFENATGINLNLGFLGLALPFSGTFARLIKLTLHRVRLHGPDELGDVLPSQRCPRLQKLSVRYAFGVDKLIIHSESLLQVDLWRLEGLRQLTVVAPALEKLKLTGCFCREQEPTSSQHFGPSAGVTGVEGFI